MFEDRWDVAETDEDGGGGDAMTQDERWTIRYEELKTFIEANKRRPSKYVMTERNAWNWLRHTQKLYNSGELKAERVEAFKRLLAFCSYHFVPQWGRCRKAEEPRRGE